MGQVWSSADFDGTNGAGHNGGRGSVLAVTAQHPGSDGTYGTSDDILAPLNREPADVSIDNSFDNDCNSPDDRVRNFVSFHQGGGFFLYGDGRVRFISENINPTVYRNLSTAAGGEVAAP